MYSPSATLAPNHTVTVQQTDIMPSVLDLLGYPESFIAFGNSVFDSTERHFSLSYLSGTYQLIHDRTALQWNGTGAAAVYDLDHDSLLLTNLLSVQPARAVVHENLLKAVIQQFNNRMSGNRLTTDREYGKR
jgi:hypothetical protein